MEAMNEHERFENGVLPHDLNLLTTFVLNIEDIDSPEDT